MPIGSSPDTFSLTPELEEKIAEILVEAKIVLIFGSAAQGRLRSESDLDLAVLFGSTLSLSELAQLTGEIEGLMGRAIDLVDLRQAGPILKMQIARTGKPIGGRSPLELARFLALTPSQYFDFKLERREAEVRMISSQ